MALATRANAWRLVRWGAAIALLFVLVTRLDLAALATLFRRVPVSRAVALLAIGMVLQGLLTARFQVAVRSWVAAVGPGERELRFSALLGDHFVSTAYNTVLPSVIGGDVIRFVLARRFGRDDESGALTVVLLDRVMGLGMLAFVPMLVAAWRWSPYAAALPVVVCVVCLAAMDRIASGVVRVVPPRFARVHGFVSSVERAVASVTARDRAVMCAWSVAYQIGTGLFFELVALSWDVGAGIHQAIWVGIPIASILSIIPISIGGMGLRESLYVEAARRSDLPPEIGLAMALCWGVVGLAYALVGLGVEARRAWASGARASAG